MTELARGAPPMTPGPPPPPAGRPPSGPPPPPPPASPTLSEDVRVAASRGQLQLVRELLAAGADLLPDKDGRSALHYAAQEGHADTCLFLVGRGCSLDAQDVMGYSPMLRAASQGAKDVVQVLLEAGCDVNLQDEHGNAALHETCWNGFSKAAELLVQHNCDVFLTNKAGFTALHLAAQNGHNESSRVLLYAGCNPDIKNNYGDTALHTAARYGHAGVARILISARCKLSEQNKNGDSVLHIAAALKRRKIAKILVESGIDIELVNKQSETAMDVAKRKEHPEIMLIISTYTKPRPQHHPTHHPAVTFKDEIEMVDGPVVSADDQPPLKQDTPNTRPEKEKKAGFFFSFKKKKKDKDKDKASSSAPTTPSTPAQKKLGASGSGAETPGSAQGTAGGHAEGSKTAVRGFFSQYVPRDGVQFYRDLAGNIKQGPIGYAPVCQCGPSLRHLESALTSTKESLHQRIDVSHHLLSRRIDDIDMRTRPMHHHHDMGRRGGYATDTALHHRSHRENHYSHSYHYQDHRPHHRHHRPYHEDDDVDDDFSDVDGEDDYEDENSLAIGVGSREGRGKTDISDNTGTNGMSGDLDYWLSDKLASYGHCLDHHHDDSALPPRNLFADFPHSALGMGRLVRSRSDETLSASDYSGKFRKRDFYKSRQAAMQQIRGWKLPGAGGASGGTGGFGGGGGVGRVSRRDKAAASSKHASDNNNNSNNNDNMGRNLIGSNNTAMSGGKRVVTEAQIHTQADSEGSRSRALPGSGDSGGHQGLLSPSTNSTTSPGTLASTSAVTRDGSGGGVSPGRKPSDYHSWYNQQHQRQQQPQQQVERDGSLSHKGRASQPRPDDFISQENNQDKQQQQQVSYGGASNPPYPTPPQYDPQHRLSQQQQRDPRSSSYSQHQQQPQNYPHHQQAAPISSFSWQHQQHNVNSSQDQSPNRQDRFSSPPPGLMEHHREKNSNAPNHQSQQDATPLTNGAGNQCGPRPGLSRYQDSYGVHYNRSKTLSSDALANDNYEEIDACPTPQPVMSRSRSVDDTLESGNIVGTHQRPTLYASGYSTDSSLRPGSNTTSLTPRRPNSPRSSGRETQSLSPAPRTTTRYRLPETSSGEAASSSPHGQRDKMGVSPRNTGSPPVPAYRSPREANTPGTFNRFVSKPSGLSRTMPSPQELNKTEMQPDQIYARPSVSSLRFGQKDKIPLYSGQNQPQLPSKRLETPTPPSSQDSSPGLPPMRECLQHDSTLLSPHLPSTVPSNGSVLVPTKEDSTCSSNQDSGYGQGRSGTDRQAGGADTSIGTPSSSFSMERSNTPSTAGSPYTSQRGGSTHSQTFNSSLQNRMNHRGHQGGRTYSPLSTGPDGSFRSSSSESHRPGEISDHSDGAPRSVHSTSHLNAAQRRFSSPLTHLSSSNDSAVSRGSAGRSHPDQKNFPSGQTPQPSSRPQTYAYSRSGNQLNDSQQSDSGSRPDYSNPSMTTEGSSPVVYNSTTLTHQSMDSDSYHPASLNPTQQRKPNSKVAPTPPPKPNMWKLSNNLHNSSQYNTPTSNSVAPNTSSDPHQIRGPSIPTSAPTTNNTSSRQPPPVQPRSTTRPLGQAGHMTQPASQAGHMTPSARQAGHMTQSAGEAGHMTRPVSQEDHMTLSANQAGHMMQPASQEGHMTQSAVQAHVEGWYQKKLLEAAQRLRQSDSYGNHPASPCYNISGGSSHSMEVHSVESTSGSSPRPALTSFNSSGRNNNYSHPFNGYSSSSPSPSPQAYKTSNYAANRSIQSPASVNQPSHHHSSQPHHQHQQQNSAPGHYPSSYNGSHTNNPNNNTGFRDSSPYSRPSANPSYPQPVTSHNSSNGSARSFASSNAAGSNYQPQPSRSTGVNQPYYRSDNQYTMNMAGFSHFDESFEKTQPASQYGPVQNGAPALDARNNNGPYQNSFHGLTRVDGGPLRYDPIHGSDV